MEPHAVNKPVMDVSAPRITLAPAPQPAPARPSAVSTPAPAATSIPQPVKQQSTKPTAPVGVLVVTVFAMMALSTVAVVIYVSS